MALKFVVGEGWEYQPPSSCCIGGGSQQSSGSGQGTSSGQSTTTPLNLQNPAFTAAAPQTAQTLQNIGLGGWFGSGPNSIDTANMMSPYQFNNGQTTSQNNPLVAPVSSAQNSTLGQIGNVIGSLPNNLGGAFNLVNNEMNPNFASNLATSAQTQSAIGSAIAPIRTQFNTQTVPGLEGSFTQAGQRIGSASGQGSSAFDNAFSNAQASEQATEAATAGQIANNAYQTGLNIQANAPSQMSALTSSELQNMINGLNAQALPQLTQQYGITAGSQLYQQQMGTILQALGLQVQGEQPSIGYSGQSTNASQESSQNQSSGSNFSLGNPFGNLPA